MSSRRLHFVLSVAAIVFVMGCSKTVDNKNDFATNIAIDLNNNSHAIECKGKFPFVPVDGVTNSVQKELTSFANSLCKKGVEKSALHSEVDATDGLHNVTSFKLEFSCQGGVEQFSVHETQNLQASCARVVENFGKNKSEE